MQEIESNDAVFRLWMVVSRKREGPKAAQKSIANSKPDLNHALKHASTIKPLEVGIRDRLPTRTKISNGKRKAQDESK